MLATFTRKPNATVEHHRRFLLKKKIIHSLCHVLCSTEGVSLQLEMLILKSEWLGGRLSAVSFVNFRAARTNQCGYDQMLRLFLQRSTHIPRSNEVFFLELNRF